MRHISLDESFWRSAIQALVSGESIEDVEPSLLDVSRLLRHLQESTNGPASGRLGLLTLGDSEEERALGLTLAALLALRGPRVLLADCNFTDQTWSRLLGADEPDGIADHVGYGTPLRRLVRRTSLEQLALLPSGTTALDPSGILRSDKLASCLEAAGRDYDLVCVGLPFDEMLEWGRGAVAGMDRAILIGPMGEEPAFELAIPRLVRRLELLTTLDVPPLGRWRPALGAALPALVQPVVACADVSPVTAEASIAAAADQKAGNGSPPREPRAPIDVPHRDAGLVTARAPLPPILTELRPSAEIPRSKLEPSLFDLGSALAAPADEAAAASDRESAADVAFLESLPRGDAPAPASDGAGTEPRLTRRHAAPLVHPRLRAVALQQQLELAPSGSEAAAEEDLKELAESWREGNEAREIAEARVEGEGVGRSLVLTALAVLLCLGLGAGGFWLWRASQLPESQFTFVDSGDEAVNDRAPGTATDGTDPAADPGPGRTAGAAPVGPHVVPMDQAAVDDEAAIDPARSGVTGASAKDDAVDGLAGDETPKGGTSSTDVKSASTEEAADGPPVRAASGTETAAPAVSYVPPASGPLLAYSLHVGSYQTFDAAQRAALALRSRGLAAFVAPVLLEGKGEWHRVFVDALPDAPASQESLARARQSGAISEGAVRETPWALYLGTFATPELAQELIARLARSGVSGYALGTGPVHVYAGAFEAAGDAEILNRQLRDRGFESALVRRRGVETR
jgi:cell division septation protein DedD